MLGIDITLQHLDEALESNSDLITLSIDFLNLQTAHISLKGVPKTSLPASVASKQKCISTPVTKSGRGTFAIVDGSEHLLNIIRKSVLSVQATLLAKEDQNDLYEHARGSVEELFFNQCSTSSDDHFCKSRSQDSQTNSRLFEKIDVYGKPSIIAHFPSITVNFVHSVGVGSIAGSVTISITILDLAKVSFTKIIGATGRILQEPPRLTTNRPISKDNMSFIVKDTLNQKLTSPTTSLMTSQIASNRTSRYEMKNISKPLDSSLDSLSLLAGNLGYSNYDSDDSVSIDGFFDAINAKRNENTNENKDTLDGRENADDSAMFNTFDSSPPSSSSSSYSPSRNDKRIPIMKNTSSLKYVKSFQGPMKMKIVDINNKSSYAKKGARVPDKAMTVKQNKEWDSSPINFIDYSKKRESKLSNSSEKRKIERKHSVEVMKKNMQTCSTTSSSCSLAVDDIDKHLELASMQIFNTFKCSVIVSPSNDHDKSTLIPLEFSHKNEAHVVS